MNVEIEDQKSRPFQRIEEWLKNKVNDDPDYLVNIVGQSYYKKCLSKFMQRYKLNINKAEFAEMFWNDCQIRKITSHDEEKKVIENYIDIITGHYNTIHARYIEQENERVGLNHACMDEINNYFNISDITIADLRSHATFADRSGFINQCWREFKNHVYARYRTIYSSPHTYDDLVSIVEFEKNLIENKIRNENDLREIANFANNNRVRPAPPPVPNQVYNKNGTVMVRKEILRHVNDKDCCICAIEYTDDDEITFLNGCKHAFHKKCIEKWSGITCPICRTAN